MFSASMKELERQIEAELAFQKPFPMHKRKPAIGYQSWYSKDHGCEVVLFRDGAVAVMGALKQSEVKFSDFTQIKKLLLENARAYHTEGVDELMKELEGVKLSIKYHLDHLAKLK